jgi:hypothetical protein
MRTWKREGYKVAEKEFDYDLHEFDVKTDGGKLIATITPGSLEEMEDIIKNLDNGEDVDGWEDGKGNTIRIENNDVEDLQSIYNEWRKAGEEASEASGTPFTWDCGEVAARADFSDYAELGGEISFEDMLELEKNYTE